MKIVYMGTPEFAVFPLKTLIEGGANVVAVVTQQDKPRDRGKKIQSTPVKILAEKYEIPVLQPKKIRGNEDFLNILKKLNPDLIVVVAYGKILPMEILKLPKLGCINIHGSILPKYRGAAPIHHVVISGEKETGVTLMYMSEAMDEGDIIGIKTTQVGRKNTSQLFQELSILGGELLLEKLGEIEAGTAKRTAQNHEEATYAPMVFKEDGHIDFSKNPEETDRVIRGMNLFPGAFTRYGQQNMKIIEAEKVDEKSTERNGTILSVDKNGIKVAAAGGTILLKKIQIPGKKPSTVEEFLRGNKIDEAILLS